MKFFTRVQVLFLLGALQTLVSATAAPQVDPAMVERSESVPSIQVVDKRTFLVGADPASAVLATAGGLVNNVVNTANGVINGVLGGVLGGVPTTVVGPSIDVGGGPYISGGPGSSYSYESQSYSEGPDCKKKLAKVRRTTGQVKEVESA